MMFRVACLGCVSVKDTEAGMLYLLGFSLLGISHVLRTGDSSEGWRQICGGHQETWISPRNFKFYTFV